MTQKTALILSAILTAFVLVIGGGIIARVSQANAVLAPAAAAPAVAAPAQAAPAPTAAAQVADVMAQAQALLQQRDAEYRQLIEQANQRLAAMNQQQAAIQAATAAQPASQPASRPVTQAAAPARAAAPQLTVSSDAALFTALQAANNATVIRSPELVRFEGIVAYEVVFTRGAVYVDANTGTVLYNGTRGHGRGNQSASSTQPPASGGEQNHEDDHETEHED